MIIKLCLFIGTVFSSTITKCMQKCNLLTYLIDICSINKTMIYSKINTICTNEILKGIRCMVL